MEDLDRLKEDLLQRVDAADLAALEEIRIGALGRSGSVTALMKGIGSLPPDERRPAGRALNEVKNAVADAIDRKKAELEDAAIDARLASDAVDVSLPVRPEPEGRIHPISQTVDEMVAIFCQMGFVVADGPHIETDFNNFTALNIPPDHPARQDHDTFYLPRRKDGSRLVLRTHTSPVQIRTMLARKPPIRIVVPGRTFRADHDATHSPMFHQIEGLVIDEGTHMGHLKGCLIEFCRAFFGIDDLPVRFRPSYFPFTEPSAEVDVRGGRGWLEVLGSGMVHPKVLDNCGVDSERYTGFAFGMGVERLAMLRYGVDDLRSFFENDLRFLKQFG